MSSRTVYTSTITVPVYASWKCEECGEVNFATGSIVVKRQESSSSWRPSKQREAEAKAASLPTHSAISGLRFRPDSISRIRRRVTDSIH